MARRVGGSCDWQHNGRRTSVDSDINASRALSDAYVAQLLMTGDAGQALIVPDRLRRSRGPARRDGGGVAGGNPSKVAIAKKARSLCAMTCATLTQLRPSRDRPIPQRSGKDSFCRLVVFQLG